MQIFIFPIKCTNRQTWACKYSYCIFTWKISRGFSLLAYFCSLQDSQILITDSICWNRNKKIKLCDNCWWKHYHLTRHSVKKNAVMIDRHGKMLISPLLQHDSTWDWLTPVIFFIKWHDVYFINELRKKYIPSFLRFMWKLDLLVAKLFFDSMTQMICTCVITKSKLSKL